MIPKQVQQFISPFTLSKGLTAFYLLYPTFFFSLSVVEVLKLSKKEPKVVVSLKKHLNIISNHCYPLLHLLRTRTLC